jgi:hypothetical protein
MGHAKVTKSFPGRLDEETKVRQIEVGEVVSGDLADVAVREGWAEAVEPDEADQPDTDKRSAAPSKDARHGRKGK